MAPLDELGLRTLYSCPCDIKLLCIQRFIRLAAYGASTLILVSFLQSLGHSRTQSGLFMTLTLIGDVCISFVLTLFADSLGRKLVLAAGATLMTFSGLVFFFFENYWVLLAAAVFGVISPSGNEIGPFRAVEESIVAQMTAAEDRSDIYAWYSLLGTAGTAVGMIVCGWVTQGLVERAGWDLKDAYRAVFVAYAVLGGLKLVFALALSPAVEAETQARVTGSETEPLINDGEASQKQTSRRRSWRSMFPVISPESRGIATALCLLFGLDAFASGLAPL